MSNVSLRAVASGDCSRARTIAAGGIRVPASHACRILLLLVLGIAASLRVQPATSAAADAILDLTEAVELASRDQPQLEAVELQRQAALEAARAERELPDPKLAFGVQNLPITGSDAWRVDRDDMTMMTVGLMQDVVTREKRRADSSRMTAEAARLAAQYELGRRQLRRDAAFSWLDVFEAQARAHSLRRLLAQMRTERQVGVSRLSSSPEPTSALLAIDTELSSMRDELIVAERDEARARAALSRWIGEHATRPLPQHLSHETPGPRMPDNKHDELDAHPALQSAERAIEVASRETDRARAERRPDWSWQLMYGQRQEDRSDMVSFQVTVGLPWNRADRQQRRIAEKLAMASAARSELRDRRRMLVAELAAVRADLDASDARLREHTERLVPAARARVEAAQASYAGGNGPLMDVWLARRKLIDAELHHDMILAERTRALSQLTWLLGEQEEAR